MASASEASGLQLALHGLESEPDSPPVMPVPLTRLSSISERTEADEPKRHRTYYIPTGDVVFQVDNTLFRMHRYFFERESQVFRDMLSLPASIQPDSSPSADEGQAPVHEQEGTSDKNPIHLSQVSSDEFESFLWVFYNPTYSQYDAPTSTWASILRLAHLWDFPSIRALAFRELENIPAATRLALGERYDASPVWRAHALTELVTRHAPLTRAEGEELGLEMVLRVTAMRENIQGWEQGREQGRNGRERVLYHINSSRSPPPRRRYRSRSRSRSPIPIVVQPPMVIHPPSPPSPHPIVIPPYTPPQAPHIVPANHWYGPGPGQPVPEPYYNNHYWPQPELVPLVMPGMHSHGGDGDGERNGRRTQKQRGMLRFFKVILRRKENN